MSINPTQLGGGKNGISVKQTITNYKNSEQTMARTVLRKSWNTPYATGTYNGKSRAIGEFRAVNNLGDFLSRQNYSCGGSNQFNGSGHRTYKGIIGSIISRCDGTGVPASICNPRFVPDSSDYIKYKKQRAMNQTYNDLSMGGDQHHASYVPLMAIRR